MMHLVHVAVGVIEDNQGRVLIARRPDHLHQGGRWEFPGGKVAEGENVISALYRELHEELGIQIKRTRPLITIEHDYGDKQVWLDVHRVTEFQGEAHGREGQAVKWVTLDELTDFNFPAANRGILNAIRLPDRYMITGEFESANDCIEKIQNAVHKGVRLIQLRAPHLADREYLLLANQILSVQSRDAIILLNTSVDVFLQTNADGLHLNSQRLMQIQERPVSRQKLLSTSVHNEVELAQAKKIDVDLLVISPVLATTSHPDDNALGWEHFADLVKMANCPVYALGGMGNADITTAQLHGAQGIAGITAMWPKN